MKLLVVEDNPKLSGFLHRAFEEEGYAVDSVSDGETAVTEVAQSTYELIILDWMLPGMDGISVCRELRQRGCVTPILMLTARTEVSEKILGLDAGADDYLPKPFDLGELLARARALTRRGGAPDVVLRVGGLCIDRLARRATLDSAVLDLTPREFTLISFLAREAGRVVPRAELLRQVWETSFDPGSNVIDAHIKNLREKLGNAARMIETVRGVGYRMVVSPPV
ncbi:MAG TPA: response regulator transcription factor [Polyangiaceae bacterium]